MKVLFLIFAFLTSTGCVSHATSVDGDNRNIQPTPTIVNSNANSAGQYAYATYQYDKTLLDKLDAENERFRQTPDEFKSVDFENFKYDFGRLKDGELEEELSGKYARGGRSAYFEDVCYVDLIGDAKKEAVVLIGKLSCGGSCDGGADDVYFYSSRNGKAQLIDVLQTGSNSSGCSLKSLTIRDKKINVEQFGKCVKETTFDYNGSMACKFCVKDETRSVYSIDKTGLKRESADVVETDVINVMESPAFISINE